MFLVGYENDSWIFTVFGMVGHEPPRDLAGMLALAVDSLEFSYLTDVQRAVRDAEARR
jgi:hypothetical protein